MSSDSPHNPQTVFPGQWKTARRRPPALKPIGRVALKATRKALSKRGISDENLIASWPEIAGQNFASATFPIALNRRSRVLTIRVADARALEFQYFEPQLLDRIATYCGARIVDRIKIVQGPLPNPSLKQRSKRPRPLNEAEMAQLESQIAGIEDPRLRTALLGLGRQITAKQPARS